MKKMGFSVIIALVLGIISLNAKEYYATVDGSKITKNDLKVILRNNNIDIDLLPKDRKDKLIDQAIQKKLFINKALKSGIEKDKSYKEALKRVKRDLALELWMQKQLKALKVSNKEIKSYFDTNKAKFKTPTILEARHILLKTQKDAQKVITTLNKAKNKKATFIKLAKEMSTGPSASKGGYLGKFPENKMVPEFAKAAKALKVGSYSKKPVKTQFGYHIIYLESKEPSKTLAYDKVKGEIKNYLLQTKFEKKMSDISKELKSKAKIVINK